KAFGRRGEGHAKEGVGGSWVLQEPGYPVLCAQQRSAATDDDTRLRIECGHTVKEVAGERVLRGPRRATVGGVQARALAEGIALSDGATDLRMDECKRPESGCGRALREGPRRAAVHRAHDNAILAHDEAALLVLEEDAQKVPPRVAGLRAPTVAAVCGMH